MRIDALSTQGLSPVQQEASVKTLKNALHLQEQEAMKLLDSLSKMTDPVLGQHIDTYA
jgi:hypothetical protein